MTEAQALRAMSLTPSGMKLLQRLIAAEATFGVGHQHALDSSKLAHNLAALGYVKPAGGKGRISLYAVSEAGRAAVAQVAKLVSGAR